MHEFLWTKMIFRYIGQILQVSLILFELMGKPKQSLHGVPVEIRSDVIEVVFGQLVRKAFWKTAILSCESTCRAFSINL